jgi:hypothetical protein
MSKLRGNLVITWTWNLLRLDYFINKRCTCWTSDSSTNRSISCFFHWLVQRRPWSLPCTLSKPGRCVHHANTSKSNWTILAYLTISFSLKLVLVIARAWNLLQFSVINKICLTLSLQFRSFAVCGRRLKPLFDF